MSKYTKVNIKVPDINRTFVSGEFNYSKPEVIKANTAMMDKIYKQYRTFTNKWGTEFEIDDSVLVGFIATESGGTNSPPNRFNATGLMQMTPNTVYETISKWERITGSALSKMSLSYFHRVIPTSKKYDSNVLPSNAVKNEISNALQNNSEFNIAIGTACLRWLLEAYREGGKTELNKVMVSYNAGYYSMKGFVKGNQTSESLLKNKKIPLESRNYLLKMLGVNGFMDLWFKNTL